MLLSIFDSDPAARAKAFNSRVWLDGVEITHDCQIADDVAGDVLVLRRDAEGRAYIVEGGDVAREWRHGRVEIRAKDADA